MSGPVRRAGRFGDADGRTVTWSVADGRRGRRWRWTIARADGALDAVHTLETDPDGTFSRLESAGPERLLTLHREADGSLHGNRVAATGVEHLAYAPAPRLVLLGGDALGLAALVAGLPPLAEAVVVELLVVSDDLATSVETARVVPDGQRSIRLELGGAIRHVELDVDGLPAGAAASTSWPLEVG